MLSCVITNSARPLQASRSMLVVIVVLADRKIIHLADLSFQAQGQSAMLSHLS